MYIRLHVSLLDCLHASSAQFALWRSFSISTCHRQTSMSLVYVSGCLLSLLAYPLSLCLSSPFSVSICLSLYICLYLCLRLFISLLSVSLSYSLSLSVCLWVSLCLSISLLLSVSRSVSLSLSPSQQSPSHLSSSLYVTPPTPLFMFLWKANLNS